MFRFFAGLRFRLILLILLTLLPAVGLILYTGMTQRRWAALYAQEEALRLSHDLSTNLDQIINLTRQFLEVLAQLPQVQNRDAAACNALFANLLHRYPAYNVIGATTPDGELFASSLPLPGPANLADTQYFQGVLKKKDFTSAEPKIDRLTGKGSVTCAYPAMDKEGQMRAVVFAALDLAWLREMTPVAQLSAGSELFIINRQGKILGRYPDPQPWVGKSLQEKEIVRTILNRRQGTAEERGIDGVSRLYAFTPLADVNSGAFVAVGIPTKNVYGPANQILVGNLMALGVVLILALGMAYLFAHKFILRRMGGLVSVAQQLAAGDLSARTGVTSPAGEFDQVACALDEMAEALQTREAERLQTEQKLQEISQKLQALFRASPGAIFVLDPEGLVKIWNPTAEYLFGWKVEEVLDQQLPIVQENIQGSFRLLKGLGLQGEAFSGVELGLQRKDGSLIEVSLSTAPLRDTEGNITGIMAIAVDLTAHKQLETQLIQAQKMEAVGRLAGGVAHDFNNFLTAMMSYGDLLLHSVREDDPLHRYTEEILKAADRASVLTRQLLAFSRKQVLEPKIINLNDVVEDVKKMLLRLIGEDLDLVTVLAPDLGLVKTDPGHIEQVILNLAINARDAMPQGGKLTIETANVFLDEAYARSHVEVRPGPYELLAISDNGTGMDAETVAHIFEPFFTTKEPGKGTGLGLATVYGIVKQSGGHIWVYSEPGHGTTFKIYFPRAEEEKATPSAEMPDIALHGRETILVVEDEDVLRSLICKELRAYGYTVLEAPQGTEALKICEQHQGTIHLALIDVIMPQMSGRTLAERLEPLAPEIKVLYMSGYTQDTIAHHGMLSKEVFFIEKPFNPATLASKVRRVLDAAPIQKVS
jgi:PAS domain S-box-containing protein